MGAELTLGDDGLIQSLNQAAVDLFGVPEPEILARPITSLLSAPPVPGKGHICPADLLRFACPDSRLLFGRRHDGSVVPLEAVGEPCDGGLRVHLHPYPAPPVLEPAMEAADVETSNRRLAVLYELLRLPSGGQPLEQQFEHFLEVVLSLRHEPGDRRGAIFIVDEQGELVLQASRNMPDNVLQQCQRLPSGACLCGQVASTGEIFAACPPRLAQMDGAPCIRDMVYFGIPIRSDDKLLGVLTCISPSAKANVQPDREFLAVVADRLGILIERQRVECENRRLLEENRLLNRQLIRALEEERRRIARELHDEMGQSLTAIKTDAALIRNRCDDSSAPSWRSASAIGDTADHLYDVIQNLLRHLRPSGLDDLGLVDALRAFLRLWRERRPGIACTFVTNGDLGALGEDLNITIYRIIQEALNNVIRHAAATRVDIALKRETTSAGSDELILRVEDNGLGVNLGNVHAKQRHGLVGIRERVQGLGGNLALDSQPRNGFRLKATFPLDDIGIGN